jgi:hypothetical protein
MQDLWLDGVRYDTQNIRAPTAPYTRVTLTPQELANIPFHRAEVQGPAHAPLWKYIHFPPTFLSERLPDQDQVVVYARRDREAEAAALLRLQARAMPYVRRGMPYPARGARWLNKK